MSYRKIMFRLMAIVLCISSGSAYANAGLDIIVVRHAETVTNATGVKDKRNDSMLSEVGLAQVEALTRELSGHHFDAVLVSPAERALLTIQPYLQQRKMTGIVWPEITECCWQQDRGDIKGGQLQKKHSIHLPPEMVAQFSFRDNDSSFKYANSNYADGVAQVREAVRLLKASYSNTGKTILIVTHYHAGGVLLGELLGVDRDSLPGLENARLTHLRQQPDGRFELLMINGQRY